jgi:hypothetical protein
VLNLNRSIKENIMKNTSLLVAKILGLTLWHMISLMLAALLINLTIGFENQGEQTIHWLTMFTVSFLETLAMVWLVNFIKLRGLRLLLVAVLVFHGTKVFMMLIEAAFFLNIWTTTPIMSMTEVWTNELLGLLMALIYCPVLVWAMGKWSSNDAYESLNHFPMPIVKLVKRLSAVSIVYTLCYLLAGAFILIPLAGDAFEPTYANLQLPAWMPLFQIARGVLWGLIILPIVMYFSGSSKHLKIGTGLLLAVLGATQLLYPNPYMVEHLRYAHILEIAVSMFAFGWLACAILGLKMKTIEE